MAGYPPFAHVRFHAKRQRRWPWRSRDVSSRSCEASNVRYESAARVSGAATRCVTGKSDGGGRGAAARGDDRARLRRKERGERGDDRRGQEVERRDERRRRAGERRVKGALVAGVRAWVLILRIRLDSLDRMPDVVQLRGLLPEDEGEGKPRCREDSTHAIHEKRRITRHWVRSQSRISRNFRGDLRIDRPRSEEHTSELQSPDHLVCRLLLE